MMQTLPKDLLRECVYWAATEDFQAPERGIAVCRYWRDSLCGEGSCRPDFTFFVRKAFGTAGHAVTRSPFPVGTSALSHKFVSLASASFAREPRLRPCQPAVVDCALQPSLPPKICSPNGNEFMGKSTRETHWLKMVVRADDVNALDLIWRHRLFSLKQKSNMLYLACRLGRTRVIRALLPTYSDWEVKAKIEPFHWAVEGDSKAAIITLLADTRLNPNQRYPLDRHPIPITYAIDLQRYNALEALATDSRIRWPHSDVIAARCVDWNEMRLHKIWGERAL